MEDTNYKEGFFKIAKWRNWLDAKECLRLESFILSNYRFESCLCYELINNPRSLIYHELRGFNKVTFKQINMKTTEIAILSLTLISTGFGILLTLKYITLKTYYRGKCRQYDDTVAELQERIETMSKNIDYLKDRIKKKEKEYLSLKNKTK